MVASPNEYGWGRTSCKNKSSKHLRCFKEMINLSGLQCALFLGFFGWLTIPKAKMRYSSRWGLTQPTQLQLSVWSGKKYQSPPKNPKDSVQDCSYFVRIRLDNANNGLGSPSTTLPTMLSSGVMKNKDEKKIRQKGWNVKFKYKYFRRKFKKIWLDNK